MAAFTEAAKGLARNPLGIIALFISFVYALASIVIGASAKTLAPWERVPLIYFIVLFPIITLISFVYLVINHHPKLYAPKDYSKDESFLSTANINFQLSTEPLDKLSSDNITTSEIMSSLLASSFSGATILYAFYLSLKYNKTFTLNNLVSHCPYLEIQYCHGFIIAARAIGAIGFSTEDSNKGANDLRFKSDYVAEEISSVINTQVFEYAHEFPEFPELTNSLNSLRDVFTAPSSQTPPAAAA